MMRRKHDPCVPVRAGRALEVLPEIDNDFVLCECGLKKVGVAPIL